MTALLSAVSLLLGTLHGTVMRGPITPVCSVGTPCSAPAKHVTLSFTRVGVTRKTTTDERGRYRIRLAAGLYSVRTNQRPFGTMPQPRSVRVRGGRDTRVNFEIDTGIR
jgi:Carboxypeptidase regulatory-like domain